MFQFSTHCYYESELHRVMKSIVRGVLAAALPLAFITACSQGGTGAFAPSAPNQGNAVQQHPMDLGPASLHAAGATFPAIAYSLGVQPTGVATGTQPGPGTGSLFANYGGSGTIYYCQTGSGFGRGIFVGSNTAGSTAACASLGSSPTGAGGRVDPLDFVGSDVALKSTEYTTYRTNRFAANGEPFEFPSIGGPIVFGYKQGDLTGLGSNRLKLSQWTYCAIANGTITDWSDAAITADNGGHSVTNGASLPLTFVHRSDSSGTTYLLQNHLNTICTATWPAPYNAAPYQTSSRNASWSPRATGSTWNGTAGLAGSGNAGVLTAIQQKTGATGYVEGAYAARAGRPTVSQALLRNKSGNFSDPTVAANVAASLSTVSITTGGGSDNVNLSSVGDTRPDCILFVNPSEFVNPAQSNGYPIVGVTYLLFYGSNNGVHTADKTKLINYITSSAANSVVSSFEYSPLGSSVQSQVQAAANGTGTYSGKACIK